MGEKVIEQLVDFFPRRVPVYGIPVFGYDGAVFTVSVTSVEVTTFRSRTSARAR